MLPKTKQNLKYSQKHFSDYPHEIRQIILLYFTLLKEIFSSLNLNKSVGPNSILIIILKLTKDDFSLHLADIYNGPFSTGPFPTILKIANVIHIKLLSHSPRFSLAI